MSINIDNCTYAISFYSLIVCTEKIMNDSADNIKSLSSVAYNAQTAKYLSISQ